MIDPAPLLQLEHVSRHLGGRDVVRELDLGLARGQVLGLLGVNGAGKSTTLAMMAGAQLPDRGRVLLEGRDLAGDPRLCGRTVGWLPERAPLWPELSVREHLDAHARLHGLRGAQVRARREALLERLALGREARRLVGVLSQGQRQRVGLACALLHEPDLLVLDEPGNGLDPLQAALLRELIREHADGGGGVVLSTHLLPEVTAVCDRVAILHEGRLRHDAPLAAEAGHVRLTLAEPVDPARLAALAPVAQARTDDHDRHRFAVQLREGHDRAALARAVVEAGWPLLGLEAADGSLEQAFMRIATRRAADLTERAA